MLFFMPCTILTRFVPHCPNKTIQSSLMYKAFLKYFSPSLLLLKLLGAIRWVVLLEELKGFFKITPLTFTEELETAGQWSG